MRSRASISEPSSCSLVYVVRWYSTLKMASSNGLPPSSCTVPYRIVRSRPSLRMYDYNGQIHEKLDTIRRPKRHLESPARITIFEGHELAAAAYVSTVVHGVGTRFRKHTGDWHHISCLVSAWFHLIISLGTFDAPLDNHVSLLLPRPIPRLSPSAYKNPVHSTVLPLLPLFLPSSKSKNNSNGTICHDESSLFSLSFSPPWKLSVGEGGEGDHSCFVAKTFCFDDKSLGSGDGKSSDIGSSPLFSFGFEKTRRVGVWMSLMGRDRKSVV